jgi:hypothetical protein
VLFFLTSSHNLKMVQHVGSSVPHSFLNFVPLLHWQ